jgi:hypothetical protein
LRIGAIRGDLCWGGHDYELARRLRRFADGRL